MTSFKTKIDNSKLPVHVAVIMDGNGRWAKQHNRPRVFGHKNGVKAVREISEAAAELGIQYLTLYAFSTENWNRPSFEVNALMTLLVTTLKEEIKTLNDNDIRLSAIGNLESLPRKTYQALLENIEQTAGNTRMTLNLALNYSGKWDLTNMVKKISEKAKSGQIEIEDIDDLMIKKELTTANIPDPELLIRTSGECRISNFLLWELAYSEMYFSDILWPDFRKEHFYQALVDFQSRERRFGKTSEQLKPKL